MAGKGLFAGAQVATTPTTDDSGNTTYKIQVDSGVTGGGDASAVNQTSQITQETLINTRLGDITSPAAGSVNARLAVLNTTLGTPYQAGGALPLPSGAATSALQTTINTTLGTPMQNTGGTVTAAQATAANFQGTFRGVDATNAAPTVNPLYISCLVSSGVPAYTTARVAPPTLTVAGELITAGGIGVNAGDGLGVGINQIVGRDGTSRNTGVALFQWNGASYDRVVKPNAAARLLSSAATTNATSVKASAGNLFKIIGNNTVASKRYLKLYNKASAPTVGTDTPVLTLPILASAAFDFSFVAGMYFATGIAFAITAAAADADTTAIASGDIECLNIGYA